MRKLVLGTTAVILALTGGYFFLWNQQAGRFEAMAKAQIDALNAAPEAEGFDMSLTYAGMSVEGFPFSHRLRLQDPVLTTDMTPAGLERWLIAHGIEGGSSGDETPVHSALSLQGSANLAVHYLTTSMDWTLDGTLSGDDRIMNEPLAWKQETPGKTSCSVDFRSSALSSLVNTFMLGKPSSGDELVKHLDSVRCALPAQRTVNAANGELLLANEPSEFTLTDLKLGDPAQSAFSLHLQFPSFEMHDAYGRFYGSIGSGITPSAYQVPVLRRFEMTGASRLLMDMKAVLPPLSEAEHDPMTAGDVLIDVSRFQTGNKLWNLDAPFFMQVKNNQGTYDVAVRTDNSLKIDQAFDLALQEAMQSLSAEPDFAAEMQTYFPTATPEDIATFLSEALPRLSGFGTIRTKLDISSSTNAEKPMEAGGITVKALDFVTDIYALTMQGSFDMPKKEGLLTLQCRQCDKLVADAVEYSNRFQKASMQVRPDMHPVIVTTEAYEAIMAFLNGLDTDKADDVLTITVASNGEGAVTVSGKPALQVMLEGMQVMQHLQPSGAQ
jgi:hypothetical protein